MVRRLIAQAYGSNFVRNAAVLTVGSFVAQLIPLVMLPLFARMFDASVFGMQAILQVGMMMLAPLATGYYDWAIPTPRQHHRARGLATIAMVSTLCVSALALLILLVLKQPIIDLLHIPEIGEWIYAFPAIVLGTALTNVANYWLLRGGKYGLQSINKLALALSGGLITLACGLLHMPYGLLIGFVGGIAFGAVWSLAQAVRNGFHPVRDAPKGFYGSLLRQFRHYPIYGSIPAAITNLAAQIPLLIITATYSLSAAGHFAVARNTLYGGVLLLSTCVGQVVLKHVADHVKAGKRVWPDFIRIVFWLALFSACLTAGVYVIGPWFFHLYLGAGWQDSAEIIRKLAFVSFFWMMGPTLSLGVIAVQRIRAVALWQVLYGVVEPFLLLFTHLPFAQFLWCIVGFEVIAYALYTAIMIVTMRQYDRQQPAPRQGA